MMYIIKVDGIDFVANEDDIKALIDEWLHVYEILDDDIFACSQAICESKEVVQFIFEMLHNSKFNFDFFDFSKYKSNNLCEFNIKATKPLVVAGFEEYTDFLTKEYYDGNKKQIYAGGFVDEGKLRLYSSINMAREPYLYDHKKLLFFFSNAEYDIFQKYAPDFCSYSMHPIDFNQTFKPKNEEDFDNLSAYYNVYKKRQFNSR